MKQRTVGDGSRAECEGKRHFKLVGCAVCGIVCGVCHCKSKAPKKPFSCPLCPGTYNSKAGVTRHLRTHHTLPDQPSANFSKCFICGQVFSRRSGGLLRHFKEIHAANCNAVLPSLEASHCGTQTSKESSTLVSCLSGHETKSTPPTISCRHCNALLPSLESYENHFVEEHHQATLSQFRCGLCGVQCRTAMKLWIHQRKNHRRASRKRGKYRSRYVAISHAHIKKSSKVRKSCLRSQQRGRPKRFHLSSKRWFIKSRGFSRHSCKSSTPKNALLPPHDPFTPVEVPLAGPTSSQKGYKCVLCGRILTRMAHFRSHMNLHMGIYPYQCTLCNETFASSSSRHAHYHQKHTPYRMRPWSHACGSDVTGGKEEEVKLVDLS